MWDGLNYFGSANKTSTGVTSKYAGSYGSSTMSTCLNGGTVASGAFDGGIGFTTTIDIGTGNSFSNLRNAHIYSVKLTDAQLQEITSA
jgi:hypothetical protein